MDQDVKNVLFVNGRLGDTELKIYAIRTLMRNGLYKEFKYYLNRWKV